MHKSHAKRRRDIKNKLMAAICMLLVSSIMMVSSTYAWFTLSTAPEVTGITTAVGANGNLEMALMPKNGLVGDITSSAGDSILNIEARNTTWGNLVDVSDDTIYGLDKITLYPSALSLTDDGKINVGASILQTPAYGADGRVSELVSDSVTGYYNKNSENFTPNEDFGVRAVGTASGMTDRQLSYRNARSAGNTAAAQAANKASASLNNNGSALANLAIKHALAENGNDKYTQADVAALRAMVNDLKGTASEKGALSYIETAYMQYILAYAASAKTGETDTVWSAVSGAVNKTGATLDSVITAIGEDNIPAEVKTGIDKYKAAAQKVATADSALAELEDDGEGAEFTWDQVSSAMTSLVDASQMKLNGMPVSDAKNNISQVVSSVLSEGGLKVQVASGAGVYADIADQSGDFSASIVIEKVEYSGTTLENMNARMETKTSVSPAYLTAVGTAVGAAGAPSSGSNTVLPITDMYGYIIDLAFRTNAAESKLLLQQDAADRIYDNNSNEQTMGHGASMTFMATTTDFSNDQVKGLMDSITMVFFNPADGTIYCYGGLDTANATVGADGVTAKIYLYNYTAEKTVYTQENYTQGSTKEYYTRAEASRSYTKVENPVEGNLGQYYVADELAEGGYAQATSFDATTTYYTLTINYTYNKVDAATAEGAAAGTLYVATKTPAAKAEITDNAIMSLTQNTEQALSVLVYLDGETITNADVAATGTSSMTGTMNLQFASSANLVPMEYADLHIPGATTESTGTASSESGGTASSDPSEAPSEP